MFQEARKAAIHSQANVPFKIFGFGGKGSWVGGCQRPGTKWNVSPVCGASCSSGLEIMLLFVMSLKLRLATNVRSLVSTSGFVPNIEIS